MISITDAREHKDLGSAHSPTTQNHLTRCSKPQPFPKPLRVYIECQILSIRSENLSISTPVALLSSMNTLVTWLWVSTVRFFPTNRSAKALYVPDLRKNIDTVAKVPPT